MVIKRLSLIIFTFGFSFSIYAQEINITEQLKTIENGDIEKVRSDLESLKRKNPNDPSVMFLDAVLTENGEEAFNKYNLIIQRYPNSAYADASLYRIYSYNYALGLYKTASENLSVLKMKYPFSPYIKYAERIIPLENEVIPILNELNKIEEGKYEEVKIKRTDEKYDYTIQAGAFLVIENAINLASKMQKDGLNAAISSKEIAGANFNVITVGKFRSKEEAQAEVVKLDLKYNLKCSVIKLD